MKEELIHGDNCLNNISGIPRLQEFFSKEENLKYMIYGAC